MSKSKKPGSSWVGLNPEGVTLLDLSILESGQLGDPKKRWPDGDRREAARWIAERWGFLRRPIAPQRWSAIKSVVLKELRRRAEASGTTPWQELEKCVIAAMFQAIDEVRGALTPHLRENLRKRVNSIVTDDLLGSEWRRRPPEDIAGLEEVLPDLTAPVRQAQIEAALDLETFVSKAHLTKREAEVIAAVRRGEGPDEGAQRLGIKPGNFRVTCHRALRKLREAVQGAASET